MVSYEDTVLLWHSFLGEFKYECYCFVVVSGLGSLWLAPVTILAMLCHLLMPCALLEGKETSHCSATAGRKALPSSA